MLTRLAVALAGLALAVGLSAPAAAHPMSVSTVRLDVGIDAVDADVSLPLDELSTAFGQDFTAQTVLTEPTLSMLRDYVARHVSATDDGATPAEPGSTWHTQVVGGTVENVDGVDNLVLQAQLVPSSGQVGSFVFHDDAIVDKLASHRIFVFGRYAATGDYTELAMLSWQTDSVPVRPAESPVAEAGNDPGAQGFGPAIGLGIHHIGAGSDHLLFLVMLLLPAPLIQVGRRWTGRQEVRRATLRVVHVVTAFAVGHSLTLALGAFGLVDVPTRIVEAGIALSVLVSAIHAIRPLVHRGEVLIAGGFGLLHGLAFATLLADLGLGRDHLLATLLGFNLGVEVTQLLVVALVMPSLIAISRTRHYGALRTGLAATGLVLAAAWFAERVGVLAANPLEPLANVLVDHPFVVVTVLAALAVASTAHRRTLVSVEARGMSPGQPAGREPAPAAQPSSVGGQVGASGE